MKSSMKIMFVAAHRFNRSPSQRSRFEQYFDFLESNGCICVLKNIINESDDKIFYSNGNVLYKLFLLIKFFVIRMKHVFQALGYDIIFIQREAYFMGPAFFEFLFKLTGKKIVFDFDDAIWLPNVSDGNKKFVKLKFPQKINYILKISDLIFAGNNYLANYAKQFNQAVKVIPSTIDLNYYKVKLHNSQRVCIGWSGSPTTIQHFETLLPVLKKLKEKYADAICITVYGDANYTNESLGIKGIAWHPETEVSILNTFDIGIMPLPDTDWANGKCSMKGLQYMGLATATLMANVGTNKEVIENGVNGFLANNDTEWYNYLCKLIEDKQLRESIGNKGLQTIQQKYSTAANQQFYLDSFKALLRL